MPAEPQLPTAFEVIFRAPGLYPERIPIAKVAATLSAIKRLASGQVFGEEDEEEEEAEEGTDSTVGLVAVKRGSAVFRFAGKSPGAAIERFREAGRILLHPETVGKGEFVLRPVKDLSAIAKSLECTIILKQVGRGSQILATVDGDSYVRISRSALLKGDTAVSGKVMRVGGATEMRCGLRVPFQNRMLFCTVSSKDVARKLGDLLYQPVFARGEARWVKSSMRIFSFKIMSVTQAKTGHILESLDVIWEAGMKDWEKLEDPDSALQEMRGEE